MQLKAELDEKLPLDIKLTPEFKSLLALIKKQNLQSVTDLKSYIEKELEKEGAWLKENKKHSVEGTLNRLISQHARHYDFLKLIRDKIFPYL